MLALCACGKKEEVPQVSEALDSAVFGTWNQISTDGSTTLEDIGIPSGYTFNEDGTGTDLFWDMNFSYQTSAGVLYIDYEDASCDDAKYTYSIESNVITMKRIADDSIVMTYAKDVPEEHATEAATQAPTETTAEEPVEEY